MKNKIFDIFKVIVLALMFSVGVGYVLADWQSPPVDPTDCPGSTPGCNTPINVSDDLQDKIGPLGVGGLGVFGGGLLVDSQAMIGSTPFAPLNMALRVIGKLGASEYCDQNGANCHVIADLVGGGGGGNGVSQILPGNNITISPGTGTGAVTINANTGGNSTWIQSGINQYSSLPGNVGLGETNPQAKLDVLSTQSGAAALKVRNLGTTSNTYGIHITTAGTSGGGVGLYVNGFAAGGGKAIVVPDGGGAIEVGNGGITLGGVNRNTWPTGSGDITSVGVVNSGGVLVNDGVSTVNSGAVTVKLKNCNQGLILKKGSGVDEWNCAADLTGGSDSGDNLGNHTATQNIELNSKYLSNDGGNEGLAIDNSGQVSVSSNLLVSNASNQGDLAFYGELRPEGQTCGVGQGLKKTAAEQWVCADYPSTPFDFLATTVTYNKGSNNHQEFTLGNHHVCFLKAVAERNDVGNLVQCDLNGTASSAASSWTIDVRGADCSAICF